MVSPALQALVATRAPNRPYCGYRKDYVQIRPRETALTLPYLQINSPSHIAWLVLDIDKPATAFAWDDVGLPVPTFVAVNRENDRPHVVYALASPVCVSDAARTHPIRYLAAIEQAYTRRIGADVMFNGPTMKNPLHTRWHVIEPANAPQYELGHLADFVDLPKRLAPKPIGIGRNCDLFDMLRSWAYRAVRGYWRPGGMEAWAEAVRRHAEALNTFTEALGHSEVAGIARSVARYVWRNTTPAGFHEVQAVRGRLGAAASAQVKRDRREQAILETIRQLSLPGWTPSMRDVARQLGCSASTLSSGYKHLWYATDDEEFEMGPPGNTWSGHNEG